MAKIPLYNTDIVPPRNRPELTGLADSDIFIVEDLADNKIKKLTKANAKDTLGIDNLDGRLTTLEGSGSGSVQEQIQIAIDDLAGAGRTTETVKGNADEIADIKVDVAQNASDIDNLDGRVDTIVDGQALDPNKDLEVLDARHSNTTQISYPSIGKRMDDLDARFIEKGHMYGCRMSKTTGISERLYEAVGLEYRQQIDTVGQKSDFSSVYPWSDILTIKVDKDGKVLCTIDHPDFETTDGDMVVVIPVHWGRSFEDGDWEQDEISSVARVGFPAQGFTKADGTVMPYVLFGNVPTTNDGSTPHSWANSPPTVNKPLYHATTGFQTEAINKSDIVTWSNMTFDVYEMLWRLIRIEIAGVSTGYNVKGVIGQGINDIGGAYSSSNLNVCTVATTDANTFIIAKTRSQHFYEGMMVQVGTSYTSQSIAKDRYIVGITEHDASNDVIVLDGDPFTTTLTSQISAWGQPVPIEQIMALGNESGYVLQFGSTVKSHVCYRGIWDLWGNVWQWMTGILRNDLQFYVCHDPVLANVSTPVGKTGWKATGIAPDVANDYLKERQFFHDQFGSFGFPKVTGGGAGSTTWYAARAHYVNSGYMGVRAVLCGGYWLIGSGVGFYWAGSGVPAVAGVSVGGRLILL